MRNLVTFILSCSKSLIPSDISSSSSGDHLLLLAIQDASPAQNRIDKIYKIEKLAHKKKCLGYN
jgi:hypothetical protein